MPVVCPECHIENSEDSRFCSACGNQLTSAEASPALTQTILPPQASSGKGKLFAGRYLILSTLGRGGMGDVYKVRDTKLHEVMALKTLRPEIAADPGFIERFRNELKLARKITHRNICRVFDFHEEEGTPFITMEYMEGENLKNRIKDQGKLPEAEALNIAIQIAEGLAEAHGLGVVHRDLKPQNVMIEPGGGAKIMDFGIARSSDAAGLTQTGQMIGTPDYLSSEQAAGEPADHRADIYALGVILYEMTTGRLPFEGDTALSVITKHREAAAEDPKEINPDISEGLSRLILRCMEKDPTRRYQSSKELLEELRALEAGKAPRTLTGENRGLFRTRKRALIFGAVAVTLAVTAIILWKGRGSGPSLASAPEKPSLAVLYFVNNTGDEGLDNWRSAFAELLTTDLSQSRYLKILPGDQVYQILGDLGQLESAGYSSDILRQVAEKGRVRYVLRGSYIRAGSKFRVNFALHDMSSGDVVATETSEAEDEESLFALVDDLTKRVKTGLMLTSEQIAGDIDEAAVEVTTTSPEAYKLFVEGLQHHYKAEYQLSIDLMDKAIAIDPEFCSAYAWKAWAYDSAGYQTEFAAAIKKALDLSKKVSDRERARIEASYYTRIGNDIPKALEVLQRAVRLYPDDVYVNHMLGYLFYSLDDYESAVKYFRHNIDNRVEMFYSYYVMAWAQMCLGNYDEARKVCELFIAEKGDHPEMRFSLSVGYLCLGVYDKALEEAQKAASFPAYQGWWNDLLQGGILQAKGDIVGAEGHYRNLADSRDVRSGVIGSEQLSELALLRGRFEEAESQAGRAIQLAGAAGDAADLSRLYGLLAHIRLQKRDPKTALEASERALEFGDKSMDADGAIRMARHLQGLSQLAMGNSEAARETAKEIEALAAGDTNPKNAKDYLHLAGSLAMARGNIGPAVKSFEEAASMLPAQNQNDLSGFKDMLRRTIFLASLAEAQYRAGQLADARRTYESLTSLTIGRHHWGDLYVRAFYGLGRISEDEGKTEEAAAHYRRFLGLWKDADPGLPEVEDARDRLAGLKGS